MRQVNTVFSPLSTICWLPSPTDWPEAKQMVDLSTFSGRLDYAIAAHGLTNAGFAHMVDQDKGQQMVTNWRSRHRVGGPSLAIVRAILHKTNMEWLNENIGSPFKVADQDGELMQIKLALSCLVAAMAKHRPAEGEDAAAAIRDLPECVPGSTLDELAEALEAAAGRQQR